MQVLFKRLQMVKESRQQQGNSQAMGASGASGFQPMTQRPPAGQNHPVPFPPQLQRQMQASPLPQQPPSQPTARIDQPAHAVPSGPAQAGQASRPMRNTVQAQPTQAASTNMNYKMTPEESEKINRLARQLAQNTSQEDMHRLKQSLAQHMTPEKMQAYKAKGIDPLAAWFRERAMRDLRRQRQGFMSNNADDTGEVAGNTSAMPGQPGGRMDQTSVQTGTAPFLSNPDHFHSVQVNGLRSQQQGQLVVPASNGQGINTENLHPAQFGHNRHDIKQRLAAQNQQLLDPSMQPSVMPASSNPQQQQQQQQQQPRQPQLERANNVAELSSHQQARHQGDTGPKTPQQQQQQQQQQPQHPPPAPPTSTMVPTSGLRSDRHHQHTPQTTTTTPALNMGRAGGGGAGQGLIPPRNQGTPQPRPSLQGPGPPGPAGMQQTLSQDGRPSHGHHQHQPPPPQHAYQQPGPQQQASTQAQALAALPPQLQGYLKGQPPPQWNQIVAKYMQQTGQRPLGPAAAPPGMSSSVSQPGHQAQTPHRQVPTTGSALSQPMPPSTSAGLAAPQPSGPGMVAPGQGIFRSQQTPQRQFQQPVHANATHRPVPPQMTHPSLAPVARQPNESLANVPGLIPYMDQQVIPQQILQAVAAGGGLPGNIKLWGHLKQYLAQHPNPRLPLDQIPLSQARHYQMMQIAAHEAHGQNSRAGDPPSAPGPLSGSQYPLHLQNNVANAPIDPQTGEPGGGQSVVTTSALANELHRLRASNPNLARLPDQQLQAYLPSFRRNEAQKRMEAANVPPSVPPPSAAPGQMQTHARSTVSTRPRQSQPNPNVPQAAVAPTPGRAIDHGDPAKANVQPPSALSQPTNGTAARPNSQTGQGKKRGHDGEAAGAARPELGGQSTAPQQPALYPQFRQLSQAELSTLTPERQKMYQDTMHKWQQQQNLWMYVLRLEGEVQRTTPLSQPLVLNQTSRSRMKRILTAPETKQLLTRFKYLLRQYVFSQQSLEAIKEVLEYKVYLFRQYTQESIKACSWEPLEEFTIGVHHADSAIKDLRARFKMISPPSNEAINSTGSHPLSQDNLHRHTDQAAEKERRTDQASAPPQPGAVHDPVRPGGTSPRGHGTPRYAPSDGKTGLQPEVLKLPDKKKKRVHEPIPEAPLATGQTDPATSLQPTKAAQPRKTPFKCTIAACEYNIKGFGTKADLDAHFAATHKPADEHIADPLAFFLDSIGTGLKLEDGRQDTKPISSEKSQKAAAATAAAATKPGEIQSTTDKAAVDRTPEVQQASGTKQTQAKANTPHLKGKDSKAGKNKNDPTSQSTEMMSHGNNKLVNAELGKALNTFLGDMPPSADVHDPLIVRDDTDNFIDQFIDSEAWTQIQECSAAGIVSVDSSKAATSVDNSPALLSDRDHGQSSHSEPISAGSAADDRFIKISSKQTELADSWAMPDLQLRSDDVPGDLKGDDMHTGVSTRKEAAATTIDHDRELKDWMAMEFPGTSTIGVEASVMDLDHRRDVDTDVHMKDYDLADFELNSDLDFDLERDPLAVSDKDFEWKEFDWSSLTSSSAQPHTTGRQQQQQGSTVGRPNHAQAIKGPLSKDKINKTAHPTRRDGKSADDKNNKQQK